MLNPTVWFKDKTRFLAAALLVLGLFVYACLSLYYAHHMTVIFDEGSYLLKGKWFLDGTYRLYEQQGPIANKMPLSFWVPGLSQVLFGEGIRSGRYFSILQSLLILAALWLTARRFSASPWIGVALVWACVLNQNWIMYYARPMSQVTTALFIVWGLYFLLGRERKSGEVITGFILAVCVVLTRQNMLPFLALAFLYVLWEHGWKKGGMAALAGGLVFLLVHIYYWPDIYHTIWYSTLPGFMTGALISLGLLEILPRMDGIAAFQPQHTPLAIIREMFGGIRYSLLPVWFMLAGFLAYPFRHFSTHPRFKAFVFLLLSYLAMIMLHAWAVVSWDTILYSFPGYFAFFNPIGLLLLPFLYEALPQNISKLRGLLIGLLVLVVSAGIGMHQDRPFATFLLNLPVSRMRELRFEPGSVELWRVISNRFGIGYFEQEPWVTALAGLLVGLLILAVAFALWFFWGRQQASYAFTLLVLVGLLAFALSPTNILSGRGAVFLCDADSIQSYEQVGESLREIIPDGSLVYWGVHTRPSLAILLYLPEVRTFPSQLNGDYYFRKGGSTDLALSLNYWNEELAERWLFEADYLLLNDKDFAPWAGFVYETHAEQFEYIETTQPLFACDNKSVLHVYRVVK